MPHGVLEPFPESFDWQQQPNPNSQSCKCFKNATEHLWYSDTFNIYYDVIINLNVLFIKWVTGDWRGSLGKRAQMGGPELGQNMREGGPEAARVTRFENSVFISLGCKLPNRTWGAVDPVVPEYEVLNINIEYD